MKKWLLLIFLSIPITPVYGNPPGELYSSIPLIETKDIRNSELHNLDLYAMDNYNSSTREYHRLVYRPAESNYEITLNISLDGLVAEDKVVNLFTVHSNGTIYLQSYNTTSKTDHIWRLNSTMHVDKIFDIPNMRIDHRAYNYKSFVLRDNHFVFFLTNATAVWISPGGKVDKSIDLFPRGFHHPIGDIGEQAALSEVEQDETGFWIRSIAVNSRRTNFDGRFYHVDKNTGEYDKVLEYDPPNLYTMEIFNGFLYYIAAKSINGVISYVMFRINMASAETTTKNSPFPFIASILAISVYVLRRIRSNLLD